jgi:putative PIN family toxin of toxin-antitoxin system
MCESVFEHCLDRHEILVSDSLLDEIRRNLAKKVKLEQRTIEGIDRLLRENGTTLEPVKVFAKACRDADDLHVLGLAKAGHAEYIVTGDGDLLSLKRYESCRIVSPRQFWTLMQALTKPPI